MRDSGSWSGRTGLVALAVGLGMLAGTGPRAGAAPPGGCCGGGGHGGGEEGGAAAAATEEGGGHGGHGSGSGGEGGRETEPPSGKDEPRGVLLDLGNAKCPIMGGRPDGKTWSEWKGLRVGHCCPMCAGKFNADPEGSLKKAGVEWKEAADAAAKLEKARGADLEKLLAAVAKRWKVLRAPEPGKPAPVVVDLANASCPVRRDEAPDGKTYAVWKGLRVGLCCSDCVPKFEEAPEAALDAAGIAWKAAAEAVRRVNESSGASREKALAELRRKWRVVEPPAPARKPAEK